MFRSMYKYDLAEAEAFDEWKEDESDMYESSKPKTLIQTMNWFEWLEAEDESGEDEEDDEEEEEEEFAQY